MKILLTILSLLVIGFVFPKKTDAIVFLPALLLIPIAKIVALVIGGLALPALGIGVLWQRLYRSNPKKVILVLVGILFLVAVILAVILKITNTDRPLI